MQLTNVAPAATAVNLKSKWKQQCKVNGYRRADDFFRDDQWSGSCFLQPIHFLHPLSEGCGTRLTNPNYSETSKLVYQAVDTQEKLQRHFQSVIITSSKVITTLSIRHNHNTNESYTHYITQSSPYINIKAIITLSISIVSMHNHHLHLVALGASVKCISLANQKLQNYLKDNISALIFDWMWNW